MKVTEELLRTDVSDRVVACVSRIKRRQDDAALAEASDWFRLMGEPADPVMALPWWRRWAIGLGLARRPR